MRDEGKEKKKKKVCLTVFLEPNRLSTAMIYKATDDWERQV